MKAILLSFLYLFYFFVVFLRNRSPRDARTTRAFTAKKRRLVPISFMFFGAKLKAAKRQGCRFTAAQGIEAVSFFAGGKKDTSG
ncbi:MAG: hypothetical protein LBL20_01265 [Treponema sp.]|jgi:hypothetical protein|nr:hypothetical protein [Treponema sp.]